VGSPEEGVKKSQCTAPGIRQELTLARSARSTVAQKKIRHLESNKCPFANLPDASRGLWGKGLTAEKMKECHWLQA
jgi:hypothetical protein